ncbi:hypothetical protein VTN02DRAFT_5853 [Thermoascus thermophilus]
MATKPKLNLPQPQRDPVRPAPRPASAPSAFVLETSTFAARDRPLWCSFGRHVCSAPSTLGFPGHATGTSSPDSVPGGLARNILISSGGTRDGASLQIGKQHMT